MIQWVLTGDPGGGGEHVGVARRRGGRLTQRRVPAAGVDDARRHQFEWAEETGEVGRRVVVDRGDVP
jgi:hypothetical protein